MSLVVDFEVGAGRKSKPVKSTPPKEKVRSASSGVRNYIPSWNPSHSEGADRMLEEVAQEQPAITLDMVASISERLFQLRNEKLTNKARASETR